MPRTSLFIRINGCHDVLNRIVYDLGGTAVGTVLTLAFLPALYAIWFRVGHVERNHTRHQQADDLRFAASQPTGAFVHV